MNLVAYAKNLGPPLISSNGSFHNANGDRVSNLSFKVSNDSGH
jgi:hypothetical protein